MAPVDSRSWYTPPILWWVQREPYHPGLMYSSAGSFISSTRYLGISSVILYALKMIDLSGSSTTAITASEPVSFAVVGMPTGTFALRQMVVFLSPDEK